MVEALIQGFLPGPWVEELDFSTLEKVGSSFGTDDVRDRHDDLIWRVRRQGDGSWVFLYLLLEFQSTDPPFMGTRITTYVGLLYQDLVRVEGLQRGDFLPLVIPVVFYNGPRRWRPATDVGELIGEIPDDLEGFRPRLRYHLVDKNAVDPTELALAGNPVACLLLPEKCSRAADFPPSFAALKKSLAAPEHSELRRAFAIWLVRVFLPGRLPSVSIPDIDNLEEVGTMIEESIPTWTAQWEQQGIEKGLTLGIEQGRQQGIEQGRQQGESALLARLIERKFGPLDAATRSRVESADAEQLLAWGEQVLTARRLSDVFGD